MDKREALKSMLNNLINDKHEEASMDLHGYMTAKMQEISGIGQQAATEPAVEDEELTADDEIDTE